MKKYFVILFFLPCWIYAQNYSTVETVDSLSKDQLFSLASAWYAHYFKSSQNVIQLSDKEGGKIIGKALFTSGMGSMGNKKAVINYTITTMVKDGKYKMEVGDFVHSGGDFGAGYSGGPLTNERPACGTLFMTMKWWNKTKEKAKEEADLAMADFKKFLTSEKQKEDF